MGWGETTFVAKPKRKKKSEFESHGNVTRQYREEGLANILQSVKG